MQIKFANSFSFFIANLALSTLIRILLIQNALEFSQFQPDQQRYILLSALCTIKSPYRMRAVTRN